MNYMTLNEASEKGGASPRRTNCYCAAGRISGAGKTATIRLISKIAEKPIDGRIMQGGKQKYE